MPPPDPPDPPGRLAAAALARLAGAGCVAPEAEVAELLAAAPDAATLEGWLARREAGEPLPWLTGRCRFGGLVLRIDPGVYVPRPQSEELARRAARHLPPGGRALDLCTGAGAVAAHLQAADPTARVVGVDLDGPAVRCARRNGVRAVLGDLDGPLRPAPTFDVVTAVAPYVPRRAIGLLPADVVRWEPRWALDGGDDGLAVVRRVVAAAGRLLRPGGHLVVEIGADQDTRLAPDLRRAGLGSIERWTDDDGDLRGLLAGR